MGFRRVYERRGGCNRNRESALKKFSADQNTFCIGGLIFLKGQNVIINRVFLMNMERAFIRGAHIWGAYILGV